MTIIAYRDGVMAGDGMSTRNGCISGLRKVKVCKNRHGDLLGSAGSSDYCHRAAEWFLTTKDYSDPPTGGEYDGSLLVMNGNLFHVQGAIIPIEAKELYGFEAIGSASEIALGAMAMGASATEAVEVACKFSTDCGGEIHSVRLDSLEAAA
jgi:hypothetical protein